MLVAPIKIDAGVMILENSYSAPLQHKPKHSNPPPPKPTPQDPLNSWSYCNPSNFEDSLPQPYRFITRCLNELLLNRVYSEVFEIEKYKFDSNYEGTVKEVPSSGSFDIEGISFLAFSEGNPYNHLFAGDFYGTLFLLDLNKKVQITKISVIPMKRILHISANTIKDEESITTICVISRGEPFINVFRYKAGDNKLYKSFVINLLKKTEIPDKNTSIFQYPYSSKISLESKFIAVSLYNGNSELFLLPEAQLSRPNSNSQSQNDFKTIKPFGKSQENLIKPQSPSFNLETTIIEINEPFYIIAVKLPLKKKTYEETLSFFIQNAEKKHLEEPLDPKKEKKPLINDSKDLKKILQKASETAINSDFELNEAQFLGESLYNEKEGDISNDFRLPDYRAEVFFIAEKLYLPNEAKIFCKLKEFLITTGLALVWVKQKTVDFHRIQSLNKENLPGFILQRINLANLEENRPNSVNSSVNSSEKTPLMNKPSDLSKKTAIGNIVKPGENIVKTQEIKGFFEKKLVKSLEVLYGITCAAMNSSCTFLAIGLEDGSVFTYDLLLFQEHCYLDKHTKEVSMIKFCEDWTIISGSSDGIIHVYSLRNNRLEMKRSNVFKPNGLEIKSIEVSEIGLAIVVDNQFNARVYDLVHYEKIMRLMPISVMEENKKMWCLWPKCVMSAQKDQFCIVVNQLEKDSPIPESLTHPSFKKNSKLLIFRIFDNLLNIFPALSNLSRKGVPKDKLYNAFQRMSFSDLKNSQFDINIYGENTDKKSRSFVANQMKTSSRILPVIDENAKPNMKTLTNYKGKANESNSSITFSKVHTKESEIHSSIDLNSSFKTLPAEGVLYGKNTKGKKNEKTNEGLTKEALHPENILNESKKTPAPELFHPVKDPIQQTINFTKDKLIRQEKMEKTFSKISSDLELKEVRNNLRKKKEMLEKTMK